MNTDTSTDHIDFIERWARAICRAETAHADDLSRAMGIDTAGASRIGCQLICAPPAGTGEFEFVLDLDREQEVVVFVEFTLTAGVPLDDFRALFGAGREAMPGPHQVSPTHIFDPVWPDGAPRACAVLADLTDDWPREERVRSVTLYLRHQPSADELLVRDG